MPNQAPVFTAPDSSIRRVSTTQSGAPLDGPGFNGSGDNLIASYGAIFSPDGTRLVFSSQATNLVDGDTNGLSDIFVKDLLSGAVTRVSTDAAGGQGSGAFGSYTATFSPDGGKLLFESGMGNLAPGDSNQAIDLYVKDLATGAVTLVTGRADGQAAGGYRGIFSPDGTKVAFVSASADLVAGDTNGLADIFVRTLATGAIVRISVGAAGEQATAAGNWMGSGDPIFSPDGGRILFTSNADLLPGGSGGETGLYLKDLASGALSRVSTDSAGNAVSADYSNASFSPDGGSILFTSTAANLVAGDTNGVSDIFLKNLATGVVTRISTDANGAQLAAASDRASFSPDGGRIVFETLADPGAEFNGAVDIFVKDLASGAVTWVSRAADGSAGTSGNSQFAHFSPDGSSIAFLSSAFGLVPGPAGQYVYLATIGSAATVWRENGDAVPILAAVNLSDDGANFAGGRLTIAITLGASAGDSLSLAPSGSPGAGIAIAGSSILFNGVEIGTLSGGGTSLEIALNANANAASVQALALASRFVNTSEDPGGPERQVTFTLVDGGGTADGGHDTAGFTRTIEVVSVNDRPSGADHVVNLAEDQGYTFQVSDFGFSDPDGDNLLLVQIFTQSVPADLGRFYFDADGPGAAAPAPFDGFEIGAADLAAGKLSFVPAADFFGTLQLGFRVRDDGGSAGGIDLDYADHSNVITIQIESGNDAPLVSMPEGAAEFVEGANVDAEVPIALGLTLRDPDNPNAGAIVSAEIRISGNYHPDQDRLTLPPFGGLALDSHFDVATGILTITATDAVRTDDWAQAIGNVRYTNLSDAPSIDVRTLTITVSDGIASSLPATRSLVVTATNDAPMVDLDSAQPGNSVFTLYTEREPARILAPNATVADPDSPSFAGAVLKVEKFSTTGAQTDMLGFLSQGDGPGEIRIAGNAIFHSGVEVATFAGGGAGDLVVTFGAAADAATAQAVLRAITYRNDSSNPPNPGPSYTVTLTDGDGATSLGASLGVGMILVPDPTIFDLNGAADGLMTPVTFTEGGAAFEIAPLAVVSDADTDNFGNQFFSAALTNPSAGDNLTLLLGGAVNLDGQFLAVNGMIVGTINVLSPTSFTVNFTSQFVPVEAIQALVRAVGYVNLSNAPQVYDRNLRFSLNGFQTSSVQNATIHVVAVDAPPVAMDDAVSVASSGTVRIRVTANDSDSDGGPKNVETIAGVAATVGAPVTLASGARVTLNADGTLTYDPSGALGAGANDSFAYGLNGGSSASVAVHVFAGAGATLLGTAGADEIFGGVGAESFDLHQGGSDRVAGGEGADGFYFGAALDSGDRVDGGPGTDTLAVQGNVAVTLGEIVNVEVLLALSGSDTRFGDQSDQRYDYAIATTDANVAAGATLTVQATGLLPGEDLAFDGSAESDGNFRIFAGRGDDTLRGGSGNDGFFFGAEGNLTAADRVDGGAGVDSIALRGDYTGAAAIVFAPGSFANIEVLALLSSHSNEYSGVIVPGGFDYDLTLADANLAAGRSLDINGGGLRADESIRLDGRRESDGALRIFSGAGDDLLWGGAKGDLLYGAGGADRMDGGAGADIFVYRSAAESTGTGYDTITGFDYREDRIDAPGGTRTVGQAAGTLSMSSFDADLASALDGQLGAGKAVLFTANGGSLSGHLFAVVDVNGIAGYQLGEDLVIELAAPAVPIDPNGIMIV